ncbi:MAG: phosphoribosyltransferase family protein [Bacteroidota bacterium]
MHLLDHRQINAKVKRLAMEIMEYNADEEELYLIGINNRGLELAERFQRELASHGMENTHLWNVRLSPADPLAEPAELENPIEGLAGKAILLVDDVANTGRTLFYALLPLLKVLPKKIEVAVLVDREHKSFPVHVTYVGLQLSTTIGDNVLVEFGQKDHAVLE